MSTMYAYSYVVLRYMHDTTTREFINVGVALFSPEARYAGALCRSTIGRLRKTFPNMNPDHFKSLMRYIQGRFEEMGVEYQDQLRFEHPSNALALAERVLPKDDSSLQWSPLGTGRSDDPAATLEALFERMVMRYEERGQRERREEEDVWRGFKRTLEAKQLLRYFEPKTLAVQDDEVEFKHTWKNGVLHCVEPVSFDLATAESIRYKAHRWLGRIASIHEAGAEPFRMYFLVGAPQEEELQRAYHNALSILQKVPVEKKIFSEQQAEEFGQVVASEVEQHLSSAS